MASNDITLYFAPGASAIFPHFLLYHCNIPFTPQGVRLKGPSPVDLSSINDKNQVPILILNGETITENPAIAHAINQLAPDAKIFGETPIELIKVCEWMNWLSAAVHAQAWGPWLRPWRFTTSTDEKEQKNVKAAAEEKVLERFARVESILAGPWALGERFTAVDVYLLVFWRVGRDVMKRDMEGDYPRWGAIMKRLEGMEAYGRVMEDEERVKAAS